MGDGTPTWNLKSIDLLPNLTIYPVRTVIDAKIECKISCFVNSCNI